MESWQKLEVSFPKAKLENWFAFLSAMDRSSQEEYLLIKETDFEEFLSLLQYSTMTPYRVKDLKKLSKNTKKFKEFVKKNMK